MVVGMHRRLGAARGPHQFIGAVGHHLVDVHVGLGSRSGLPDDKREVIVEMPVGDVLGGGDDGVGARLVKCA